MRKILKIEIFNKLRRRKEAVIILIQLKISCYRLVLMFFYLKKLKVVVEELNSVKTLRIFRNKLKKFQDLKIIIEVLNLDLFLKI